MTRPASPCPFYRILCEYVPMADRTDELEVENKKLREALGEMLEDWDDLDPDFPEMRVAKARAALGGDT